MSAAYDDFISMLAELEEPSFLEDVAENLGIEVKKLIDEGFVSNSTPYGEQWVRGGRYPWPVLQKTGAMRAGFHVETNSAGVKVTNPVEYATYQNNGTRYISANAMVPDNSRGLGDWEEPLRNSARDTLNRHING